MKKQLDWHGVLLLAGICIVIISLITGKSVKSYKAALQTRLVKIPLRFESNYGQWPDSIKFMVHGGDNNIFLTDQGLTLHSFKPRSAALQLKFMNKNISARASGVQQGPMKSNYFLGNDPDKWLTDVPTYGQVCYHDLYPGIDLVFYGSGQSLEYDFIVEPGARPQAIQLAFADTARTSIDGNGNLLVKGSKWFFKKPLAYQEADGQRTMVSACYSEAGKNRYTFTITNYDPARPLIIDPIIVNFKFHLPISFGPSDEDITGFCVDVDGNSYMTGTTSATDFYTKNPFQRWKSGLDVQKDVFIMKINASGNDVVYSTYLGGPNDEEAAGIAVDMQGNAYVTGATMSADYDGYPFPTKNPLQPHHGGFIDAFVTKLNAAGNDLVYSTYVGGGKRDVSFAGGSDKTTGIAVDQQGNAYIIGQTISHDDAATVENESFPWLNPIVAPNDVNTVFNGAFLAKINAVGSALLFSTPLFTLGGTATDIGVDASGNVYACGEASETTILPVKNAFQPSYQGGVTDVWVEKIKADGSALVYSSYLGGSKTDINPNFSSTVGTRLGNLSHCFYVQNFENSLKCGATKYVDFSCF